MIIDVSLKVAYFDLVTKGRQPGPRLRCPLRRRQGGNRTLIPRSAQRDSTTLNLQIGPPSSTGRTYAHSRPTLSGERAGGAIRATVGATANPPSLRRDPRRPIRYAYVLVNHGADKVRQVRKA